MHRNSVSSRTDSLNAHQQTTEMENTDLVEHVCEAGQIWTEYAATMCNE